MKRIFFVLLFFVSTHVFAQIKIGVAGGYNSAIFDQYGETPDGDYGNTSSSISTFNAGIISEIPLGKKIFLQPSLLYFGSGTHIDGQGNTAGYQSYAHTTMQVYNLLLPVNAVYKIKLVKRVHLLLGAGLYAAKGLSGTAKGDEVGKGPDSAPSVYSFNGKVYFSNAASSANDTNINPYDLGFNILAGVEWRSLQLTANFSHGFSQVYSQSLFDYKNAVLGVSLAYLFSLKK